MMRSETLKGWLAILAIFCSVPALGQESPIEKLAYRNAAAAVATLDTVINYTVYGTHGEPLNHSVRMRLSFNRQGDLVQAAHVYQDTTIFRHYYFHKGELIFAEWIDHNEKDVINFAEGKGVSSLARHPRIAAILQVAKSWSR